MEESGASRAQQQVGQVRLPGVTGSAPAPTAANNNGAALASVSVNVMGGQGTMPSSRQAMAATTSYTLFTKARVSLRSMWNRMPRLKCQQHNIGGMESTGSTVQGCLSPYLPVLLQLT